MPRAAPAHVSSSANRRPDIRSVTKANAMMGQVTYTPRLLSSASRGNLEKARKKPEPIKSHSILVGHMLSQNQSMKCTVASFVPIA